MVRWFTLTLLLWSRAACLDQEDDDAMWERPEDPLAPLGEDGSPPTEGSHTTINEAAPSEPESEEADEDEPTSPPSGAAWNDDAF